MLRICLKSLSLLNHQFSLSYSNRLELQMSSQYNRFDILTSKIMHVNLSDLEELKKYLREIIVKIRLERIDIQREVTVEVLLNSSVISLIISSEFVRK